MTSDLERHPASGDGTEPAHADVPARPPADEAPLAAEASTGPGPAGVEPITGAEEQPTGRAGAVAPASTATADETIPPPTGTREAAPMTRRRKALLLLLTGLCTVFLAFTAWYLVNRKPITQLPLPAIAADLVPHYAFSLYGVTAPTGVAVSPDGSRIYVTQTEGNARVLVFDRNGRTLATATPPPETGSAHTPVYLALDPTSGDLYVSDRPTGSIYVYSAEGVYRRTLDPGPGLVGWQPLGLSFDAQGHLFVTDVSGPYHRVHEFGPDGQLLRSIGSAGLLNFPNGVAVDARGNVYVADSNNGRLVVFDASGRQLAVVRRGAAQGDLGLPRGVTVDGDGRVYVVDTMAQGVQVYRAYQAGERAPAFVGRFGAEGTADGGFEYPNGVATDARGRVYVTDWRNNRVQVWSW